MLVGLMALVNENVFCVCVIALSKVWLMSLTRGPIFKTFHRHKNHKILKMV